MRFLLTCAVTLLFYLTSSLGVASEAAPDSNANVQAFVEWVIEDGDRLGNVRFAEVVEAVSGKKILPVDANHAADAEMLAVMQEVIAAMLIDLSRPEHPVHLAGRINETSRHVEDYLLHHLNREGLVECNLPLNATGSLQRSGYPDLRLKHLPSGRIFYLDPKVYHEKSENSSFRTFYFEPKGATNKILDEASHLILGISHAGKVEGRWQFKEWKLVDLVDFRVRLKAEFQASNRDLYREEAVLLRSTTP
ncbi:MAG: hypothetical protein ACNA77_02525 [Opitutales bacterium]